MMIIMIIIIIKFVIYIYIYISTTMEQADKNLKGNVSVQVSEAKVYVQ